MSKTTELKTQEGGAMVEQQPDWLKDQTTTRGSENVKAEDLVIPRLELVQDLSPCRKKADPNYIDGCEEGMLYNNVTRQLYGREALIIPVYFRKEWLIWKDRNEGGGFRGSFQSEDEAIHAMAELEDGQHCEVVDTAQHFCLLINPISGKVDEIVLSMSRTKAKVSRKLNSLIRMNGGDSLSRVYHIGAVSEKNSRNQDYFNFMVSPAGYPARATYDKAEALYKSIAAGKVNVKADTQFEGTGEDPGNTGSGEY